MKLLKSLRPVCAAAAAVCAGLAFTPAQLRAADHRDGPTNAHDAATDLADAYFFQDPVNADNLVLIATFHGFIVPGEAANEAIFDPVVNYRFEIYNDHVNDAAPPTEDDGKKAIKKYLERIKPARTIDVSFSPRVALPGPTGKEILQVPQAQTATAVFSGFKGLPGFTGKKSTFTGLLVLNPTLAGASPDPTTAVSDVGDTGIKFFAGEVDDPFFFDIPGFGRTIGRVRNGDPLTTAAAELSRGRDTFSGYNALAIAFTIPKAALLNEDPAKDKIGVNVIGQRRATELNRNDGTVKGVGSFKAVDREGNPAINVALIPFNRKNEYNASTPKDDASGQFAGDIVATLQTINPSITTIPLLASIAVGFGDLLTLDTGTPAAWPNGRKPSDDVIDTALTVIASIDNGMGGFVTIKDNVDTNDVAFETVFPYLGKTQQPRAPVPMTPADQVDDNTQN